MTNVSKGRSKYYKIIKNLPYIQNDHHVCFDLTKSHKKMRAYHSNYNGNHVFSCEILRDHGVRDLTPHGVRNHGVRAHIL